MLFQHLLGAALWTFQESIFCKLTWKWLWEKSFFCMDEKPITQCMDLVHTRKRESKERLGLGKRFPEPNLPSPTKSHDYRQATFARVSFFKRIQLLLEMVMQITWCCYHGQRKYQYQYARWEEDCSPNKPFQNFKLYQERFHLPDRAAVSTFDPHQLTHRLGWTISSIYFVTPSLDMVPWITEILEFSCSANCWFWMFQDRMTNYINIFTHIHHHFRLQNGTSVSLN